jgi:uncharacterized protein (TIGR02001 family)
MRKSLITTAVLGALAAPSFVFAADLTVAYNVGLYSQYIFRGLTQTDRRPALQGGVDLTHSSGFYLGAWGSNIDWLRSSYGPTGAVIDPYYTKGGNLEVDLYGGYRTELGKSGIGIDVGALQYWYPGTLNAGYAKANTTELYGALSYGWLQAKLSGVVSNAAWGYGKSSNAAQDDAQGTYYAELNATIPIGDLVGGEAFKGVTGLVHVARQDFKGNLNEPASYNDWKLGLQKSFESGVNIGAYYTDTNAKADMWTYAGRNIGDATGTAYIQKTF